MFGSSCFALTLEVDGFLQVVHRFRVLLQIQLGKSGNFPGFRIVGMRSRELFCFLRRCRKLFLFEQQDTRASCQRERPYLLLVEPAAHRATSRWSWFAARSATASVRVSTADRPRGFCGRLRRLPVGASGPGCLGLDRCRCQQKHCADADKTLNKRRSTHNAHDCIGRGLGLKAQNYRIA